MEQKRIVILDNGHGRDTKGKRSPIWKDGTRLFEYEFNRDIVRRLSDLLMSEGIDFAVLVTETNDVSLKERCKRANELYDQVDGNCFLISIHANAGGGTGFEVYTSKGHTRADDMATVLFQEMKKEFPEWKARADMRDGDPDKEDQFYILRNTKAPAMLSENFFMDTEKDCRLIMSNEGRDRIAKAHFEAIKKLIV